MDTWLVVFILGSMTIGCAFVIALLFYTNQKQQQENQERLRIADRFESSAELATFLESKAGRRYLASFGGPKTTDPRRTILGGIPVGVTFFLVGVGTFLGISKGTLEEGLTFPGVIFFGAGLGILISAFISYRLIRAWGMSDHGDL